MAKVESPNKHYNGPGPGGAVFVDGQAETDDGAALNYYRGAGYKVSGKIDSPLPEQEVPDPREYEDEVVGTRLRDAAVDPRPEDFLPPINAGKENPHGPAVVSPEIHASGPAGIRPGVVAVDNLGKQEAREKAFAEKRLIERVSADEANHSAVGDFDKRGPVGLSDPGSAEAGVAAAKADGDTSDAAPKKTQPKKAASK